MPNQITLGNAIGSQLVGAMQNKNKAISNASQDISTGMKTVNDVVSNFLARNLNRKYVIGEAIVENTGYFKNVVDLAEATYGLVEKELTDISATLKKAAGASESNREIFNSIMQQKFANVERIINNARFDGIKVVSGEAGYDPRINNAYSTQAISVKSLTPGTDFAGGAASAGSATITIANTIVDGDTVKVGNQEFVARTNKANLSANEFSVDDVTNTDVIARELLTKILENKDESTKRYAYTISNSVITVSQRSISTENVKVSSNQSTNLAVAITDAAAHGVDASGILNMPNFKDDLKVNFERVGDFIVSAGGDNAAAQQASVYNSAAKAVLEAGSGADGDTAVQVKMTLGAGEDAKQFNGFIFYTNAGGQTGGTKVEMVHDATGESFSVQWATGLAATIANNTEADTEVAKLNTLFSSARFRQSIYLDVNNSQGEIQVDGKAVANTHGTTVSLTTTNPSNLKFDDFKVEAGNAAGDVKFTAVIDGRDFVLNVAAANISNLVQGYRLDLIESATGDSLSINLGKDGLTSLSEAANYSAVEDAYKAMLMNQGDGFDVVVSLSGDSLKIQIPSLKEQSLYTMDDGSFMSSKKLDITANGDIDVAEEVLANAINYVSQGQVKISNMGADLESAADLLSSINQRSLDASKGFSEADMNESAQEFTKNLNQMQAMLSVVRANESVVRNVLQNLQQLG